MERDAYDPLSAQLPDNLPRYLTESGQFSFARLTLQDIDNTLVLKVNNPAMAGEEICLFHRNFASGGEYFARLHGAVGSALANRGGLPVVRFADGEYAFYRNTLHCNGLYRQAESLQAIREVMPTHIRALETLGRKGILAPLVFPGNTRRKPRSFFSFFHRSSGDDSAALFLDFLHDHGVALTSDNYLPFYAIYAYLTSADFARLVDGKKMCIINSDWNEAACRRWFERFSSRPALVCVDIPTEYVATRWEAMREGVLANIPPDIDICLVGAGVGALPVCVDVAEHFSIPAIDAGHILNMMNGREDKSNGPRLYTLRSKI